MSVLTQGLAAEDRIPVATTQLPPAQERLEEAPTTSGIVLPPNREGQAPNLRLVRRPGSVRAVCPITPAPAAPPAQPALRPLPGFFIVNPLVMGSEALLSDLFI